MNRAGFLKAAAAALAAPYVARIERVADGLAAIAPDTGTLGSTITVTGDGAWAEVGDIVRLCNTGEVLTIIKKDGPTTWLVRRGIGSVAPHPIRRGDSMLRIARIAHEGDDLPF